MADKQQMGKVSQVLTKALESEEQKETSGKTKRYDDMLNISNAMNGSFTTLDYDFPLKLIAISGYDGVKRPALVTDLNEIQELNIEYLKQEVNKYAHQNLIQCDDTIAKNITRMWLNTCDEIDESEIDLIGLRDSHHPTRQRLTFELNKMDTPIFDELINRVNGKKDLMAFIGSLLDNESDRAQYVWIHGKGANGKSSLLKFLQAILKTTYTNQEPPKPGREHFWKAGILGKRLVAFPDCNHAAFPSSGYFKGLTGDDTHEIEKKGKEPFQAIINTKFIFMSNEIPNISNQEAELRRAIVVHVEKLPKNKKIQSQKEYVQSLIDEAPGILHKCWNEYLPHMQGNGGIIKVSKEVTDIREDIVREGEEIFESVFNKHLHIAKDKKIRGADLMGILEGTALKRSIQVKKFKEWMKDRKKIEIFRDKYGIGYRGVGIGPSRESDY